MRRLIFSKANHQLESRIQEIWQSGSEGGAKPTFVPTPIATPKSRPVGYGVIRAGVRTDSMIGVTKFRVRKLKTFMLYDFWPTIQFFPWQTLCRAGSGNGPLHRAAARTSSDTNLS